MEKANKFSSKSILLTRNKIIEIFQTNEISGGSEGDIFFARSAENPSKIYVFKRFYSEFPDSFMENEIFIMKTLIKSQFSIHLLDIQIYQEKIDKNSYEILMEYGGKSLDFLLKENLRNKMKFGVSDLKRYYRDTINALSNFNKIASDLNPNFIFFHGDISPGHILINQQNEIKICDYGMSLIKTETEFKNGIKVFGKDPITVAPEILKTDFVKNPKSSDIYSVGLSFLMILANLIDEDLYEINEMRKNEEKHNEYLEILYEKARKNYADNLSELENFLSEIKLLVKYKENDRKLFY